MSACVWVCLCVPVCVWCQLAHGVALKWAVLNLNQVTEQTGVSFWDKPRVLCNAHSHNTGPRAHTYMIPDTHNPHTTLLQLHNNMYPDPLLPPQTPLRSLQFDSHLSSHWDWGAATPDSSWIFFFQLYQNKISLRFILLSCERVLPEDSGPGLWARCSVGP